MYIHAYQSLSSIVYLSVVYLQVPASDSESNELKMSIMTKRKVSDSDIKTYLQISLL